MYRVVLIPMASATCSSSRIAFHARPIRESWSRNETKTAIDAEDERHVVEVLPVFGISMPNRAGAGIPRKPCGPPTPS